jgi:excisionase family DNA binding protein
VKRPAATMRPMGLITVAEAAARYALSGRRIRKLLQDKAIAGTKIATVWLVDEDTLKAYLATRRPPGRPKRES